ncbi:MAG: single-stranded-DNA-specific exonuclease RecJ [Patescibacteria group bacterium]
MKKYLVRENKGTTLLDHLLFHRGVVSPDSTQAFLNPDYSKHIHDPFLMKGIDVAVGRILEAVEKKEKIIIYSDYDTDGIPAGVILHDFFKKIGFANFSNYIPHRHNEGFGLNIEAIEGFAKDEAKILITLDCGTGDFDQVARANELGIDVIIVDHHLPVGKLPEAFAILNPKQQGCEYPDKNLCGAGVTFKLIQALITKMTGSPSTSLGATALTRGWEKWLLDMVAIATLSDMVPLVGENRLFAYYGMMVLKKSPRAGLVKLLSKLKVNQKHLTEEDVGFTIGPRINAASRMGVPMDAFKLLSTTDESEADALADHLNEINDERKGTVAALAKEIKKIVRERYPSNSSGQATEKSNQVMVIGNPLWKPALLGLAANTCANEYQCPVFLWGRDGDDVIKGSCRSAEKANLVELMTGASAGTFLQFGGHAFSGGFSVANDKIHTLEEELNRAYVAASSAADLAATTPVDWQFALEDVNWDTYRTIEKLAPFGTGNPKPLFIFRDVTPSEVKHFGKEKNHLELVFHNQVGKKISAITFFKTSSDWGREVVAGKLVSLVATFEKSMFKNFPELRLRIVDIV